MKKYFTKSIKIVIAFSFITFSLIGIGLVVFCIWDIFDPPLLWQFDKQANKRVMLEYVEEHYPGAKILDQAYPVSLSTTNRDVIIFKYQDVQFAVCAENGEVVSDNFTFNRASQKLDKIIIDGFLTPNNIDATINYVYANRIEPPEDLMEYNNDVTILVSIHDKDYASVNDVKWLYEFYEYWLENSIVPLWVLDYSVSMQNKELAWVQFSTDSLAENEDDFYNSFHYDYY